MSAYTDADMQTLADALRSDYDSEHDASHLRWQDFAEQASGLLSTVAPAIAARALREAADSVTGNEKMPAIPRPTLRNWLRDRADQIEAGS
jgi:hypothetical protein